MIVRTPETPRRKLAAMDLAWSQRFSGHPQMVLTAGTFEVALVWPLGSAWAAEVARHMWDDRRRQRRRFPTREAAMQGAEEWTRASLPKILTQLPVRDERGAGKVWAWPASNPRPNWFS